MIEWIILAVYAIGFVATWRRAGWLIVDEVSYGSGPQPDDIAMALIGGFFAGIAWPIIVPVYMAHQHGVLHGSTRGFLKPPKHIAKEIELEERERRIRELEREVGIR